MPHVLLVDDDPEQLEWLSELVKGEGFTVAKATSLRTARIQLTQMRPDVLLIDLQLPDAPGDQVYRTAKQIDPDLNVIVITGYPDSEVLDRILQISPVTVLKKPLKVEQLNQTVKILGHTGPKMEA